LNDDDELETLHATSNLNQLQQELDLGSACVFDQGLLVFFIKTLDSCSRHNIS
jgi:hypothetical protein